MPGPFRTKRLNARNPMRTRSRTLGKPSIKSTRLRHDNLPFLPNHTYKSRDFATRQTRSRTLGQPSINRTTLHLRPDNLPFLPSHRLYESRDFARRRTPYRAMNRSIRRPIYSPVKYRN